jgi:hypothetical protein
VLWAAPAEERACHSRLPSAAERAGCWSYAMMKLLATAGLAAACLTSPPAMSWDGWKGRDLLKACSGDSMSDQSVCIGFILGVVEGLRAGQRLAELEQGLAAPGARPSFCLDGVKPADIVELVVRDLAKSSPRALAGNSAASAIGWALTKEWPYPCSLQPLRKGPAPP